MTAPPLQLEALWYHSVHVEAFPNYSPESGDKGWVRTGFTVSRHPTEERVWSAELRIMVIANEGEPEPPYQVDIGATGVFRVHNDFPAEGSESLVRLTGGSILYSGLRDFLTGITARGPWGEWLLPTVSTETFRATERPAVERIPEILQQLGPLRLGELIEQVGERYSQEEIHRALQDLRSEGIVGVSGRGRGTRYYLQVPQP